ncbi:MAG: hypothetical protein ACXWD3_09240 [Mycobacterium sp.]
MPDFNGVMADKDGEIKTQGKVIDCITEDQEEYYGFDESDFSDPSPDGRVMLLLSYPDAPADRGSDHPRRVRECGSTRWRAGWGLQRHNGLLASVSTLDGQAGQRFPGRRSVPQRVGQHPDPITRVSDRMERVQQERVAAMRA